MKLAVARFQVLVARRSWRLSGPATNGRQEVRMIVEINDLDEKQVVDIVVGHIVALRWVTTTRVKVELTTGSVLYVSGEDAQKIMNQLD